jgi:hypothetical protein
VYKSIRAVFSFYQRKLFELLNKNLIDSFVMVKMKGYLEPIAWNMLCLPKKEGGLSITQHIWSEILRL